MTNTAEFNALSQEEQIGRLERLGRTALAEFGVVPTGIESLVHAENTTFRVDSEAGRYCLRISRPGYQSSENVRSEIALLSDLSAAGFRVPRPHQSRVVSARVPEVPEARDCVLFGWMEGEFRKSDSMTGADARLVGAAMARQHAFTRDWVCPSGFKRQETHAWAFGERAPMLTDQPHPALTEEDRALLLEVDAEARALLNALPRDPSRFGLIHADMHAGNVLFEDDHVNVIDWDDTGWAFLYYDFASALAYESDRPEYAEVRDGMLEGYASVIPLPPDCEKLIAPFIRLRIAGVANWVLERSDNPMIRERAPEWLAMFGRMIRGIRSEG